MTENKGNVVEKQFTIRMIGIQQGASQEKLIAALQRLFKQKTPEDIQKALNRLPLVLSRSARKTQAMKIKEFLESADDIQITQLIALGVPGTEMIAYSNDLGGPLTSQEVTAITTYLRSLEEDAISKPNWRTPLEDENLTGQELFILGCSRCHGVDLGGNEDVAPDISVTSFTQMEDDEFIIGRITDGYKLMPRFGRILTDEQIASIVVFMRFGTNPPPTTTTTTTTTATTGDSTTTTSGAAPDPSNDEELAIGKAIWEETAGGLGCGQCHGPDATGTIDGPGITGASRSAFRSALGGGVPDMGDLKLTPDEVTSVFAYLRWLVTQP